MHPSMPIRLLFFCLLPSSLKVGVRSSHPKYSGLDGLCRKEYLQKNPNHTACVPVPGNDAELNYDYQEFKAPVLTFLNNYRSRVALGQLDDFPSAASMMRLEWDDELMNSAYVHSRLVLLEPGQPLHDKVQDRFTTRFVLTGQSIQSLSLVTEDRGFMWKRVLKTWFDEAVFFPHALIKAYDERKEQTDNFTQIVWAATRFIGCHFAGGLQGHQYYVCNYAPAGNVKGRPIYAEGRPCSSCPQDTTCVAGLCAALEAPSPWPSFPDNDNDDVPLSAASRTPAPQQLVPVAVVLTCLLQIFCN